MAEVVRLNEALTQLDQIASYIAIFDPLAAQRVAIWLFDLGKSLATFPNRGRLASGGTRELVTVRPYILRYEVVGDTVTILSVRHAARLWDVP
ncbi:MAG: type II toxin-antitoxin system RelE/ParE family toxin [Sphingomonas sp.]|uniref:type II toxin-antitoxin system RelE/ParE family toxin n=1 Tax=Sphingomonas sp. TaxID=28214 RepID=UPI0025D458EF|nr:type II toxin-antitoxin system RelE/ParE family toxin [Sphingomonas sp.]MBX9883169.1 type II toxin-antitoxin system RelE/ParE family toxin [Sphingomonas sp.]